MAGMTGETVGRMGLGVDTSGSIGNVPLSKAVSEVCAVAETVQPELIDLLYWDHVVAGHEKYGPGEYAMLRDSTKPKGGGGTSPSCVSQYLKDNNIKLECMIILTDGYVGSDWGGDWPCPVLWCIIDGAKVTAPNGKTIYID
jgi:predicted metal-dependent peptidase